jgi:hypothetical protein
MISESDPEIPDVYKQVAELEGENDVDLSEVMTELEEIADDVSDLKAEMEDNDNTEDGDDK